MDKRTLLAVVLSVVVISVGFMLQNLLWPPEAPVTSAFGDGPQLPAGTVTEAAAEVRTTPSAGAPTVQTSRTIVVPADTDADQRERLVTIETDLVYATLSNRGGSLTSLRLKKQMDGNEPVEMIFSGTSGISPFFVIFGGADGAPVDVTFEQTIRGQYSVSYSRRFIAPVGADGQAHPFTLIKTYTFHPGHYMFELSVAIENSINDYPNLNFNGFSYTLGYGPQIGPPFDSLGGRGEFRHYYTYEGGKRQTNRLSRAGDVVIDKRFSWAGIVGKYFALLAVADDANYLLKFAEHRVEGVPSTSFLYLSRPQIRSSRNTDVFRFYAGPKLNRDLEAYNRVSDNPFGLADRNMEDSLESSPLLGWLETILRFFLDLFYRIIPNYGIAIILLTVFVKVVLYPITRKSFDSTSKMQAINPQIAEIREKYKENPNRMNQEMAALYKREKVSPLGGCLPLLLQMPIFLAMYRVMSAHFALRGAPFFWWITDLSEPESILNFGSFQIPFLGWSDLRLLPILFVVTQIFSTKFMQQPGAQTNKNMKLMTNLMPVFFFFVLYNVPSGLLVYWTMTNVLTAVQQQVITYYHKTHPGDAGGAGGKNPTPKGPAPRNIGPSSGGKPGSKRPGGGKKKK